MTPKHIEIVCNKNQVRSPFLASFLKMHFPALQFTSSGVNVVPKALQDLRAQKIASSWGFPYEIDFSVQVEEISESSSRLLPVDLKTYNWLITNFRSPKFLPSSSAIKYTGVDVPLDPIDCNDIELKYELSKLLKFGIGQLREFISTNDQNQILSVTPQTEGLYTKVFEEFLIESKEMNFILIDASLKQSNFKLLTKFGLSPLKLFEVPTPNSVYSSAVEVLESEKVFCSIEWRNWLFSLQRLAKVIIVTPPLIVEGGMQIPDSFLAAIWSDEISYFHEDFKL